MARRSDPFARTKVSVTAGTSAAESEPVYINGLTDMRVGLFMVSETSVSGSYDIQFTADKPSVVSAGNATWIDHDTLVDQTTNQAGNIYFPVTAVRAVTSTSSTGTWNLSVLQLRGA